MVNAIGGQKGDGFRSLDSALNSQLFTLNGRKPASRVSKKGLSTVERVDLNAHSFVCSYVSVLRSSRSTTNESFRLRMTDKKGGSVVLPHGPNKFFSAVRYFSWVREMTSAGSRGAGGFWSHLIASR